jgi:hypothetical protein
VAYQAYRRLYELYTPSDPRVPPSDLAVEAFAEAFKRLPSAQMLAEVPKEQAEAERKRDEEWLKRLTANLRERQDKFEVEAVRYPNPQARFKLALDQGLPGEALKNFRAHGQTDLSFIAIGAGLMLEAGQVEEARALLAAPSLSPVTVLPPAAQPQFRQLQIRLSAVVGDYERAADDLNKALATAPRTLMESSRVRDNEGQEHVVPPPLPRLLQALFPPEMTDSRTFTQLAPLFDPWSGAMFQATATAVRREQELHAERGLVALEAGDTAQARRHLHAALAPVGPALDFPYRASVAQYLGLLMRYAGSEGR